MTKNLIVRFSVEDKYLSSLFNEILHLGESLATVEDFYVPISSTYFDSFGLPPHEFGRDPKSGWPVND